MQQESQADDNNNELMLQILKASERFIKEAKRPKKRTEKTHHKTLADEMLMNEVLEDFTEIIKYKKQEMILEYGKVQFITHHTERYSYLDSARLALEGGCRWIQLRMKEATVEEIRPIALEIKKLCEDNDALFIIDDHVELVNEIKADGVHLGKSDMPIAEARQILGNTCIIGGTANTYEDIKSLKSADADYIGCGPFRYTTTKKNLSPIIGLEGYEEIMQKLRKAKMDLPIVAIGGITSEDIPGIMQTGVDGIALSGTVLQAENPVEEMKKILAIMAQ